MEAWGPSRPRSTHGRATCTSPTRSSGEGPVDLVWAYGLASNIEVFWEEPSLAAFFRRLAEFSRLSVFDQRGCGLSDAAAC